MSWDTQKSWIPDTSGEFAKLIKETRAMGLPPDRLEIVDNIARSLAENESYTTKQKNLVVKFRRGQRAMATQENKPLEPPTWEHV